MLWWWQYKHCCRCEKWFNFINFSFFLRWQVQLTVRSCLANPLIVNWYFDWLDVVYILFKYWKNEKTGVCCWGQSAVVDSHYLCFHHKTPRSSTQVTGWDGTIICCSAASAPPRPQTPIHLSGFSCLSCLLVSHIRLSHI